jgi:hypothetical protein
MAQAAYRLGFVFLAALIAAPAGAGTHNSATGPQSSSDGQTIPFSSISPDVLAPPGEEDQSDPNDGGDADRSGDAPPDDSPPVDQSANGNDRAIPA